MPPESLFLLGLLFFVAAAAGWVFARLTGPGRRDGPRGRLSPDFLRGLGFLMEREPDRALEVFSRIVEEDGAGVDPHLLLGGLYRRRGEVDGAIRIHERLLAMEDLSARDKERVVFELAQDYLGAGLFDRAEELFQKLVSGSRHKSEALAGLVSIYEQEKDWDKAIEARRDLEALQKPARKGVLAHYNCELAEQAIARDDLDEARRYLRLARVGRQRIPRCAIMRGDIAILRGDVEHAVKLYLRVIEQDAALAGEVLPRLFDCHPGDIEAVDRQLAQLVKARPELRSRLGYASIVKELPECTTLLECTRYFMNSSESLKELVSAIQPGGVEALTAEQVREVRRTMRSLCQKSGHHFCNECGFVVTGFYWQCAGCKSWDTIRPLDRFDIASDLHPDQLTP